jgi:hypothetical protein
VLGTVGGMDADFERTGMYSQRVPNTYPPAGRSCNERQKLQKKSPKQKRPNKWGVFRNKIRNQRVP